MSLDYEDREFITPAAWQKGELPHIPTVVRNKVSAKRIDRKIRVVCRASHSQNDPGSLDNNGGDVLNAVDGQTAVPTQKGSRYTFIDIEKDLQMFDVEYDFDAEDEPDVIPPPPLKLSRNQKAYVDACQLLRVAPCKMILKTIDGEDITIRNRALGSHGLKALCVALVDNVTVKSLDLEGNHICKEGGRYIADLILENGYLTELRLRENNLEIGGAECLTTMLRHNTAITVLDLAGNNFQEDSARLFADMLQVNRTLRELNLSHNSFRERGGQILGPALGNNDTLEVLDLSWNHLRRKGAVAICKGLAENIGLRTLDVSWNGFYLEGSKEMAKALAVNTTLQNLDLSCNRIDRICLKLLLKGLKANESLITLKLRENAVGLEGMMDILKQLTTMENPRLSNIDVSSQFVDETFLKTLTELQETKLPQLQIHHGHVLYKSEKSDHLSQNNTVGNSVDNTK